MNTVLQQIPFILLLNLSTIAYTNKWSDTGLETIYVSKESTRFHPTFSILQGKDELYIVVRGSNNNADFDSMLDDSEIVTNTGIYHHGYYKAALNTLYKIIPIIGSSEKTVYITGHSYGASVAIILYNLLMDLPNNLVPNKENLYAVGFATLPTSKSNNMTYNDRVFTVGNIDDIFLRFSRTNIYNTLKNYNNGFLYSKYQSSLDLNNLFSSYRVSGVPSGKDVQSFLINYIPRLVDQAHSINDGHKFKLTNTPGTVILLGRNCTSVSDCVCDPKDLPDSLPLSAEAINVHTPTPIMEELVKLKW